MAKRQQGEDRYRSSAAILAADHGAWMDRLPRLDFDEVVSTV
jgi:hypothetical protein